MKDLNKVILIGRLGADPIQRETKTGIALVQFSLATSRRVRAQVKLETEDEGTLNSEDGGLESDADELAENPGREFTEETIWHRVVAWGRQADTCQKYLHKGDSVYVEGAIRSRKYTGKDNVLRMAFEVHADTVGFLGSSSKRQNFAIAPLSIAPLAESG